MPNYFREKEPHIVRKMFPKLTHDYLRICIIIYATTDDGVQFCHSFAFSQRISFVFITFGIWWLIKCFHFSFAVYQPPSSPPPPPIPHPPGSYLGVLGFLHLLETKTTSMPTYGGIKCLVVCRLLSLSNVISMKWKWNERNNKHNSINIFISECVENFRCRQMHIELPRNLFNFPSFPRIFFLIVCVCAAASAVCCHSCDYKKKKTENNFE